MEESGFYTAVGFFLALLFATVMGLCVYGVLYTDFAQSGGTVNDQEKTRLMITATAGAAAALLAWWLQTFAAARLLAARFIYGTLAYLLSFGALGSLLVFAQRAISNPGSLDWSPTGLYFNSVGAFYEFAVDLVIASVLILIGLFIAAGLILALVGPRRIY